MTQIDALIIDDETDNCSLLKHFLLKYCPAINHIDVANGFDQAVDIINNKNFNLLFLDIILDKKTAFDLPFDWRLNGWP